MRRKTNFFATEQTEFTEKYESILPIRTVYLVATRCKRRVTAFFSFLSLSTPSLSVLCALKGYSDVSYGT